VITSYSDAKSLSKERSHEVTQEEFHHSKHDVNPRASVETYASTIAADEESVGEIESIIPPIRHICYEPDTISTTPCEFEELFPSTRRILIQHDDTTPDGNLNLRVDTELSISKGCRMKLTLFHLRMYDIAERQFSLRRYHRQSGREVCSSKRKYLKPVAKSSSPTKRGYLATALNKMNLKPLKSKPGTTSLHECEMADSDDDTGVLAAQADVRATIPTDSIRIEFSNYAQVEVHRRRRGDKRVYEFEYWGERYLWQRNAYEEEGDKVFSLELVNIATGNCISYITPDKLSRHQERIEAAQGSWVPPCSMRITQKGISSDLGDVIITTGLIALTDDCIRRRWRESHRH
jgi:hypothetical protein